MTDTNDTAIPMPPKVAAAISAIMADVPKLAKGEKNAHGNYNFASIDDFLEAVRPLCAKHGLIIVQDEESFVISDDGWLVMNFSFTLMHASGETWEHKPRRTIMVSAKMGAQAFGAAQSYALKQFERSLFQIATGEKGNDADEHPPADLPKGRAKNSRDLDWKGPMKKTELQQELRAFADALGKPMQIPDELDNLLDEYSAVLDQCRKDAPDWWLGGPSVPAEYVPLEKRIEAKRAFIAGLSKPNTVVGAG